MEKHFTSLDQRIQLRQTMERERKRKREREREFLQTLMMAERSQDAGEEKKTGKEKGGSEIGEGGEKYVPPVWGGIYSSRLRRPIWCISTGECQLGACR
ncbi:hypothetical protein AVEN_372-1 [Araneus ventricosus]|uniref:Uncharacterized protein n=1 Tax=Araneus ventricosus TaxID=182803 RepID=A0A4Y2DRX4_ARAVE|nr:hypothetical protein AVEN_372-1 [Araneus ventricosus]